MVGGGVAEALGLVIMSITPLIEVVGVMITSTSTGVAKTSHPCASEVSPSSSRVVRESRAVGVGCGDER